MSNDYLLELHKLGTFSAYALEILKAGGDRHSLQARLPEINWNAVYAESEQAGSLRRVFEEISQQCSFIIQDLAETPDKVEALAAMKCLLGEFCQLGIKANREEKAIGHGYLAEKHLGLMRAALDRVGAIGEDNPLAQWRRALVDGLEEENAQQQNKSDSG